MSLEIMRAGRVFAISEPMARSSLTQYSSPRRGALMLAILRHQLPANPHLHLGVPGVLRYSLPAFAPRSQPAQAVRFALLKDHLATDLDLAPARIAAHA